MLKAQTDIISPYIREIGLGARVWAYRISWRSFSFLFPPQFYRASGFSLPSLSVLIHMSVDFLLRGWFGAAAEVLVKNTFHDATFSLLCLADPFVSLTMCFYRKSWSIFRHPRWTLAFHHFL